MENRRKFNLLGKIKEGYRAFHFDLYLLLDFEDLENESGEDISDWIEDEFKYSFDDVLERRLIFEMSGVNRVLGRLETRTGVVNREGIGEFGDLGRVEINFSPLREIEKEDLLKRPDLKIIRIGKKVNKKLDKVDPDGKKAEVLEWVKDMLKGKEVKEEDET